MCPAPIWAADLMPRPRRDSAGRVDVSRRSWRDGASSRSQLRAPCSGPNPGRSGTVIERRAVLGNGLGESLAWRSQCSEHGRALWRGPKPGGSLGGPLRNRRPGGAKLPPPHAMPCAPLSEHISERHSFRTRGRFPAASRYRLRRAPQGSLVVARNRWLRQCLRSRIVMLAPQVRADEFLGSTFSSGVLERDFASVEFCD